MLGDKGCAWLSRVNLNGLVNLILRKQNFEEGDNDIREKGCEQLCKLESMRIRKIDFENWC